MENLKKSLGKTFLLGISFSFGILFVYAATNVISSLGGNNIESGDKIGSGWFQEVDDKLSQGGPKVWEAVKTDTAYINSSEGWQNITGLSIELTPEEKNVSFDIHFIAHGSSNNSASTNQGQPGFRIVRNGTPLVVGDTAGNRLSVHSGMPSSAHDGHSGPDGINSMLEHTSGRIIDTPNTTDTVKYTLQWRASGSQHSAVLNKTRTDYDKSFYMRAVSSLHIQKVNKQN